MDLEQYKQFVEMQRAMGGNQFFTPQNVAVMVAALCSLLGAVTVWINKKATEDVQTTVNEVKAANVDQTKTLNAVHTEVNSKTAALLAKFDAQEVMIREMTKKIATLEERENVIKVEAAVTKAAAQHVTTAPPEDTKLLKKIATTLEQCETVVGAPPAKPGDPALRAAP